MCVCSVSFCLSACLSVCMYVCVRVCVRAFMCVSCNTPPAPAHTPPAQIRPPSQLSWGTRSVFLQGGRAISYLLTGSLWRVRQYCPVTQPQPIDSPVNLVCCLLVRMRFTMYVSIHSGIDVVLLGLSTYNLFSSVFRSIRWMKYLLEISCSIDPFNFMTACTERGA